MTSALGGYALDKGNVDWAAANFGSQSNESISRQVASWTTDDFVGPMLAYNGSVMRMQDGSVMNTATGLRSKGFVPNDYFEELLSGHDLGMKDAEEYISSGRAKSHEEKYGRTFPGIEEIRAAEDAHLDFMFGLTEKGVAPLGTHFARNPTNGELYLSSDETVMLDVVEVKGSSTKLPFAYGDFALPAYGLSYTPVQSGFRMAGTQDAVIKPRNPYIRNGYSVPLQTKSSSPLITTPWVKDWRQTEQWGSNAQHGTEFAGQVLNYVAKRDAQKTLSSAWPLQRERMAKVATSELDEAAKVFKSPSGKAATSLAESAGKYGSAVRVVSAVGWGATVLEESSYIARINQEHPDKVAYATGAAVTNVAGDYVAIWGGAQAGAFAGAWPFFSVPTAGLSIPIGAAIGGLIGHFTYDYAIKPEVREGWTGVSEK